MAVFHFKNEYDEYYSVSDSDIVDVLGNYVYCTESELRKKAEQNLSEEKLQESFAVLLKDVRRVLYEDFKAVKNLDNYKDVDLARIIMAQNPKAAYQYYRDAMIVIVKVMNKLQKELDWYKGTNLSREIFGSEAAFLHQILFQICEFANIVAARQENKNYGGLYSRKIRLSSETFRMAREIPRGRTFNNDIAHISESIFLIRQTIELKVLEILQLLFVWNKRLNREVKITPDVFLKILADEAVVFSRAMSGEAMPIDIKFIIEVHQWTNMFIHTGHTYWSWEVEFVRDSIADFVFAQCQIDYDYLKSIPDKILECVKPEEREDSIVIMSDKFYEKTGVTVPTVEI